VARRTRVAAAVVALGIPMAVVAGAQPAWACSCVPADFGAQTARADVIFSGRVVGGGRPGGFLSSSADPTIWTVAVDRVYKGQAQERQEVVTAESEASCGYEFVVGRHYLVLAQHSDSSDSELVTNLCSGTRLVNQRPVPASLGPGTRPVVNGGVDGDAGVAGRAVAIGAGVAGGVALLLLGLTILRRRGRSLP
jgi:hypothetical protein